MTMISNDEIDLRPYLNALLRRWWLVVLIGTAFGIAGLLFSLFQTHQYAATATILVTRNQARLSLAEQFPTISEPIDTRSRTDALLTIVQSDALADETLQQLPEELLPEDWDYTKLQRSVKIISKGDAFLVSVTTTEPELATQIANTWANVAVETINLAYSDELPLADIQLSVASARQDYETAQAALETFIQENHIATLEKQVQEARTLYTNLAGERSWRIDYYTERKQAMEDVEVRAEALKSQLQSGTHSEAGEIGDALSVFFARAAMLDILATSETPGQTQNIQQGTTLPRTAGSPDRGLTLNMYIDDTTPLRDTTANYAADLDTLIQLARAEKDRAAQVVETLTLEVIQAEGSVEMEKLAAQVRALEKELEIEQSKEQELKSQRDLAWNAYQALVQKETELKNNAQTGIQVSLATHAILPKEPLSRNTITNTIIAGALGLFLAVIWVLVAYWWRSANLPEKELNIKGSKQATT